MKTDNQKQSPLFSAYPDGTPTMPFGGWEMPRDFGGIIEEHNAVRSEAGMFDLSHMGRLVLTGEDITDRFRSVFTRDTSEASQGQALYGFLCDESGGCIDDIIAYVRSDEEIWLVVNAGNRESVVSWLNNHMSEQSIADQTDQSVLLAIQGPEAPAWFDRLDLPSCPDKPFRSTWSGDAMVASTGYTGESGGEAWLTQERGREVFRSAFDQGLTPCGLGARDTLRLEMGYPLHGHELSRDLSPVAANLGMFIDWEHEFIGRDALDEQRQSGPEREIRGLRLDTRRSPVEEADVRLGDRVIGRVTSGRYSPTVGSGIGMALVDAGVSLDETVETEIRNEWFEADQITPPFVGKETD